MPRAALRMALEIFAASKEGDDSGGMEIFVKA